MWKKCNSCKKEIPFSTRFYICNVSTCTRKRTGLIFCSVSCWDAHVPMVNHKESWAVERKSPTAEIWAQVVAGNLEDPTFPTRERVIEKIEPKFEPALTKKTATPSNKPAVVLRRGKPSGD